VQELGDRQPNAQMDPVDQTLSQRAHQN